MRRFRMSRFGFNVLIVIPARGGSKGIPRKNLRALNGKPLISYSIATALLSKYKPDVYVSSEDDEILSFSKQLGAKVHVRDFEIATDSTTLDPVVFDAYQAAKQREGKEYHVIVTLQPTSPLLRVESLDSAIKKMIEDRDVDTMISATNDTHLTWRLENEKYIPNYKQRVNRQYLPPMYKETGGFLLTRPSVIQENSRVGRRVALFLLSGGEEIDIDSYEDWSLCSYFLKRKKILFVVSGNLEIGLGHVYNTLLVANDILDHQIQFLVDRKSLLAFEKIREQNYPVILQEEQDIVEEICRIAPNVVINDMLDTTLEYITALKKTGMKVINFEDLGEGAKIADLVVNAIYPEDRCLPNHYYGHEFFMLRDEFVFLPEIAISPSVSQVLITFGGVDPENMACKVLDSIYAFCKNRSVHICVVLGLGYQHHEMLGKYPDAEIHSNIKNMASFMAKADVAFTSAGRTIYEVASVGIPTIVLAQNKREMTHFFASSEYGFLNLGLGGNVSNEQILEVFARLVDSWETRKTMNQAMRGIDLKSGRRRVNQLIRKIVEEA